MLKFNKKKEEKKKLKLKISKIINKTQKKKKITVKACEAERLPRRIGGYLYNSSFCNAFKSSSYDSGKCK